ncbi:MAG TPA: hypothetical protein VH062_13445 [Polyangiaceae bacterium]|jgi:acetylornithine deacetylase/succinyl-diaminopimelate desuccinylase-like protein|nr:hypothetical protein [Polyangiaceae bacterium]
MTTRHVWMLAARRRHRPRRSLHRQRHSSVPQLGRNAIVEVALACAQLTHLQDNALSKAFHFIDTNIGFTFDGTLLGFTPSDAGQSTSFSADLASTDTATDTVELLINTRHRPNIASNDVILQAFKTAVGASAQVTSRGDNLPGYDFPATDPMIAFLSAR